MAGPWDTLSLPGQALQALQVGALDGGLQLAAIVFNKKVAIWRPKQTPLG